MPIAAVWTRVSTEGQQSLGYQVAEVRGWLESLGYEVPENRILKVHWTSLAILDCPDMQTLLSWIRNREIDALGMIHSDRLSGKPSHKIYILDQCKRYGVQVLSKNSPLLEGREGELIEYVLTWGKESQVLYAQQGSKGKLRDRAQRQGLPTTCQNPWGYHFDDSRTRLIATSDWETGRLIWELALGGATLKGVQRELHNRGIPSPKGKEWWPEPTIYGILTNPVYWGEYRALRREAVEPALRRGNSYGKTSSRHLPGIPVPNIVVERPVVTAEQFDWLQQRLEQNKLNARRNGKRDYLLRGLIQYEGDNLRYYGRNIRGKSWAYVYSPRGRRNGNGNPRPYLPGRKLEAWVESKTREVLASQEVLERELGWQQRAIQETIARLEDELRRLDRKENANRNAEVELLQVRVKYKDRISPEAFERQLARVETERKWIAEERDRVQQQLQNLKTKSLSLIGLEQLKGRVEERLASREFGDRRFVLEALSTRIIVTTEGAIEVEFAVPTEAPQDAIALSVPLSACPQY